MTMICLPHKWKTDRSWYFLGSWYTLESAKTSSNRFGTDCFVIIAFPTVKATHFISFSMSTRILLLGFLSITFGYFQPSRNLRVTPQSKIVLSCLTGEISTFDPLGWSQPETVVEPALIPSSCSLNNHASFRNINSIHPALFLLAVLGMGQSADAVADPLLVPMKGIELYSR